MPVRPGYDERYPPPIFQCLFPLHLFMLLAEGVVLALLKREWSLFRDIYLAALKGVKEGVCACCAASYKRSGVLGECGSFRFLVGSPINYACY